MPGWLQTARGVGATQDTSDAERIAVNVDRMFRDFAVDPTDADATSLSALMAEFKNL